MIFILELAGQPNEENLTYKTILNIRQFGTMDNLLPFQFLNKLVSCQDSSAGNDLDSPKKPFVSTKVIINDDSSYSQSAHQ